MPKPSSPLKAALSTFRTKLSTSSRQFWEAKIRALESDESLTDVQRLDILAPYFYLSKWPKSGHASSIAKPSQILIPAGEKGHVELGVDDDGALPPVSEIEREAFLPQLKLLIGANLTGVDLPEEYVELLSLANAISVAEHLCGGSAGINGVRMGLPARQHLSDMLPEQSLWEQQGWEVSAGWQCGSGNLSATKILLCRKEGDKGMPKWRVFAYDQQHVDGVWFGSIVAWIEWLGDCMARLPVGWEDMRPASPGEDYVSDEEC